MRIIFEEKKVSRCLIFFFTGIRIELLCVRPNVKDKKPKPSHSLLNKIRKKKKRENALQKNISHPKKERSEEVKEREEAAITTRKINWRKMFNPLESE